MCLFISVWMYIFNYLFIFIHWGSFSVETWMTENSFCAPGFLGTQYPFTSAFLELGLKLCATNTSLYIRLLHHYSQQIQLLCWINPDVYQLLNKENEQHKLNGILFISRDKWTLAIILKTRDYKRPCQERLKRTQKTNIRISIHVQNTDL